MNRHKFNKDLVKLIAKYPEMITMVVGYAFFETNSVGQEGVACYSTVVMTVPPKDHEEEILRDAAAKRTSDVVADLIRNSQ